MRSRSILVLSSLLLVSSGFAVACSSAANVELPYQDGGPDSSHVSSSGAGNDASTSSSGAGDASIDGAEGGVADGHVGDAASGGDGEAGTKGDAGNDGGTGAGEGGPASDGATGGDGGSPGGIWVLRVGAVGAGSAPTGLATAAFLDRFAADGTSLGTIALPTAAAGSNQPLTLSGSATSEGALTRSSDGRYVVLAGYAAAPGAGDVLADGALSPVKDAPTTGAGAVLRVLGRVDAAGTIDTSFTTTAYSGQNVRGAATVDGTAYWMFGDGSGSSDGISYQAASGGVAVFVSTGVPTVRVGSIFGGRVYGASATGSVRGVFTMPDPLPMAAETGAVLAGFPTTPGPSPYAFVALALGGADADTIYLCDDRSSGNGGGIERWKLASGTWALSATLNDSMTSGCRGLSASFDGTDVTVVVTTTETTGNHLLAFVDTPAGLATISATKLADAPANTVFRGVAFAPN
ncbi:MAG TPA: hypothetical protein VGG39_38165 [Polyangiaceae bacterium]|jgi:hypothetical protein